MRSPKAMKPTIACRNSYRSRPNRCAAPPRPRLKQSRMRVGRGGGHPLPVFGTVKGCGAPFSMGLGEPGSFSRFNGTCLPVRCDIMPILGTHPRSLGPYRPKEARMQNDCLTPDGKFLLAFEASEVKMSHWIHCPRLTRAEGGT